MVKALDRAQTGIGSRDQDPDPEQDQPIPRRKPMASIMLQYDRPTDHTRNWNDYNGRVRGWIARLLQTPGAVSFMAYRTTDGASPNTITMLEVRTLEEARRAAASDHLKAVIQEIQ